MREDFFTPPEEERNGGKGGRRARGKIERKVKKLLRTEGRGEKEGVEREGKEGGGGSAYAVRNADPFPRWPLRTISLPTAGPKNHNVPRPSPSTPSTLSAGLAPRIHNVSGDRIPLDSFNSYYQIDEAVACI